MNTIVAVIVRYNTVFASYPRLTDSEISSTRVEFMPEMDTPICLYTNVALTTGLPNFWIESKQATIALLKNNCGRGTREG